MNYSTIIINYGFTRVIIDNNKIIIVRESVPMNAIIGIQTGSYIRMNYHSIIINCGLQTYNNY